MQKALISGLALLLTAVNAWSINGHLFLTDIAQNRLIEKSPDSWDQANNVLQALRDYNASLTYHEEDHSFVECSTFADDIKYHGGAWQSDFHFEARLWTPPGDDGTYTQELKKHNMTYGMEALVQWLSSADDGEEYLDSYIYDYIQNRLYPGQKSVAESYALRLLIHYVGDMHQPFHNEAQYSEAYPDGDKGANLVDLKYHYGADELHAVWDILMYTQHVSISRPINSTYWPTFEANTVALQNAGAAAV